MKTKKEKVLNFLRVTGRAVIQGIPWVGPSLGIIVDEFTENDLDKITEKIEEFEKTMTKTQKELEKIVFEILSLSKLFTMMCHNKEKEDLNLRFEAKRNGRIYELEKLLLYNGPVESVFYEKNLKYLDDAIKKEILIGNIDENSKALLEEYRLKAMKENDPKSIIRYYLMLSDYFHIVDEYEDSKRAFEIALEYARKNSIRIDNLLVDVMISFGHILLHLNDLEGAKSIFQQSISNTENHPILRARDFFRIGEIFVFQGEYDEAIKNFNQSITICNKHTNTELSRVAYHILADDWRRMGTAYRLKNDHMKAKEYYDCADSILKRYGFRGRVWLLHGIAELHRAEKNFDEALKIYEQAKIESQRVCNINRVAHAHLGICEVKRMVKKIDLSSYDIPLDIYKRINSKWGVANTYISKGLTYIDKGKLEYAKRLFGMAKTICQELKLDCELELIERVREGNGDELHPLSLF